MSAYDDALNRLRSPATWCSGAGALVQLGDPRALVPLMHAYESRAELGKTCLYDAMEKLDGAKEARALVTRETVEERSVGVHLMELFASDEQLKPLEMVARTDPDEGVRAQARRTLGLQKQTPRWEEVMIKLLEDPDEKLRSLAIENLSTRHTDLARKALRERLSREPLPELRKRLQDAVQTNVPGGATPL